MEVIIASGEGGESWRKTREGEHCCTGIIPKDPESLTCLPIHVHETCCASIARLQKSATMLAHANSYWDSGATKTTASQQWLEQHKQQTTIATCIAYCKKGTATCKAGVGKVWQQYKMWMTSSEWKRFLPDNSILTKSWRVTIATRLSSRRRLFWRWSRCRTSALMDVDTTKYRLHYNMVYKHVQGYKSTAHRHINAAHPTPAWPHRATIKKIRLCDYVKWKDYIYEYCLLGWRRSETSL